MLEQILENQNVLLTQNVEILNRLEAMHQYLKAIEIIVEQPLKAIIDTSTKQEISIERDFTKGGLTSYCPQST